MPHAARIRANEAAWNTVNPVTGDEFDALDEGQYYAIREDGGAYSLTNDLDIGVAGLGIAFNVTAPFAADNVVAHVYQSGGYATWEAGATATFDGSGAVCLFDNSALLSVTNDAEFRLNRTGDYLLRAYNPGSGQQLRLYGDFYANTGSTFTYESGSTADFDAGCALTIAASTTITGGFGYSGAHASTFQTGTTATFQSGAALVCQAGSTVSADSFTLLGTQKVKYTSRSITRIQHTTPQAAAADWVPVNSVAMAWSAVPVNAVPLRIPLRIPHGSTLTAVRVSIQGAGGHAALPATKPTLKIYKISGGSVSQIGATATDASADFAAYETVHDITKSGLTEVIDRATYAYYAVITSEGSTNALDSMVYWGECAVTFTTTAQDED